MNANERMRTGIILGLSAVVAAIAFVFVARDARRPGPGSAWVYDADRFRETDPALLLYRETARFELGFQAARGIALARDNRLYAVGDATLRLFDADGMPIRDVALPGEPRCVAVGPQGEAYIGMDGRVAVWTPDGDRISFWPDFGPRARLVSLVWHDDEVFVADAGNRTVARHAPDGTFRATLARPAGLDEHGESVGLIVPSPHLDIAMAPDGLLRVVNPGRQRIEAVTMDGKTEWMWGRASFGIEGFSGCCNPTDIAILANGDIVTAEKGLPRVKVHRSLTGELVGVVAGPEAFDEKTAGMDLAVDSQDRIFVLDPMRGHVRIYER